jgi:CRISPR type III-B/RAMP module-associated protein Cmr5
MSTLELDRAKFALDKVNSIKDGENHGKFLIELRDLPTRLHTAGLGQTIASLLASREHKARQTIYEWLEDWLSRSPINYPVDVDNEHRLIDCIVGRNPPANAKPVSYLAASREARAVATWLKKFAEAFIERES